MVQRTTQPSVPLQKSVWAKRPDDIDPDNPEPIKALVKIKDIEFFTRLGFVLDPDELIEEPKESKEPKKAKDVKSSK